MGHIERNVSSVISPLMDMGAITVECAVISKSKFNLSAALHIYSSFEHTALVRQRLSRFHTMTVAPSGPLQPPSGSNLFPTRAQIQDEIARQRMQNLIESSDGIQQVNREQLMQRAATSIKALASIPKAPQPYRLSTELLDYQLQGLYFLVNAEHPQLPTNEKEAAQFWIKRDNEYFSGEFIVIFGQWNAILNLRYAYISCYSGVDSSRQTSFSSTRCYTL